MALDWSDLFSTCFQLSSRVKLTTGLKLVNDFGFHLFPAPVNLRFSLSSNWLPDQLLFVGLVEGISCFFLNSISVFYFIPSVHTVRNSVQIGKKRKFIIWYISTRINQMCRQIWRMPGTVPEAEILCPWPDETEKLGNLLFFSHFLSKDTGKRSIRDDCRLKHNTGTILELLLSIPIPTSFLTYNEGCWAGISKYWTRQRTSQQWVDKMNVNKPHFLGKLVS